MIFKRLTDVPMDQRGLWWRVKMLPAVVAGDVTPSNHNEGPE